MLDIYYIANTGFLLQCNNKKVLIDGIHSKNVEPYQSVDIDTMEKIIQGIPPFDNLDLLLFTHYHWDHFDGDLAIQALKNNPHLKLFSTEQTIDIIRSQARYDMSIENQLINESINLNETKDFTINNISFSAVSLIHDGDQFKDVTNYAYTVKFHDEAIYHCGDAKPSEYNYEQTNLKSQKISIALLDFPYLSLFTGRKVINKYIDPKKIYIMHLPDENKDKYNWLKTVYKSAERYKENLPPIIFCNEKNKFI